MRFVPAYGTVAESMRSMMRALLTNVIGIFLLGAAGATAQDLKGDPKSCRHAPAILAAADYLLTVPTQQNLGFWRDWHGADAAYLKIRYAGMPYPDVRSLLGALGQRSRAPQRILELSLAHANAADRAAMIAGLAPPSASKSSLPNFGASAWRALVTGGGSDWFLEELARSLKADPFVSATMPSMAQSLAGLDDETIRAFARRAEGMRLWLFAYYVYGQAADLGDLVSYLERMPEEGYPSGPGALEEKRKNALRSVLTQAYSRSFFDLSIQPPQVKALVAARPVAALMGVLAELTSRAPETEMMLASALNQTGEFRIVSEVAIGVLADIKANRLDPANEPDSVVVSMVERLDGVLKRGVRESVLSVIGMTGAHPSSETAALFVDKAIARYALAPVVRGETRTPSKPDALTRDFAWERWAGVAAALAARQPVAEEDRLVAAELLAAADKPLEALQALGSAVEWKDARHAAHAMLKRFDRRCGRLLDNPLPYLEPLYRF